MWLENPALISQRKFQRSLQVLRLRPGNFHIIYLSSDWNILQRQTIPCFKRSCFGNHYFVMYFYAGWHYHISFLPVTKSDKPNESASIWIVFNRNDSGLDIFLVHNKIDVSI